EDVDREVDRAVPSHDRQAFGHRGRGDDAAHCLLVGCHLDVALYPRFGERSGDSLDVDRAPPGRRVDRHHPTGAHQPTPWAATTPRSIARRVAEATSAISGTASRIWRMRSTSWREMRTKSPGAIDRSERSSNSDPAAHSCTARATPGSGRRL